MKKILYLILFLIFLILGLVIIPFFIPKHYYLDWITNYTESNFPVDIEIVDADLSFFPFPEINLKKVKVIIIGPEKNYPFLDASEIVLNSNWHRLIENEIVVDVDLNKTKIDLIEVAPKIYQYDYLFQKENIVQKKLEYHSWLATAWANESLNNKGLDLSNGWTLFLDQINLYDNSIKSVDINNKEIELQKVNMNLDHIFIGNNIFKSDFEGDLIYKSLHPGKISLDGSFSYDQTKQILNLLEAKVGFQGIDIELEGDIDVSSEIPNFDLGLMIKQLELSKVKKMVPELKSISSLTGNCKVNLFINGSENNLKSDYDLSCQKVNINIPDKLKLVNEKINLLGKLSFENLELMIPELALTLGPQKGFLSGKYKEENYDFKFNFSSIKFDWLKKISPAFKDIPKIRGETSLGIEFKSELDKVIGKMTVDNPKLSIKIPDSLHIQKQDFFLSQNFSYKDDQIEISKGIIKLDSLKSNYSSKYDLKNSDLNLTLKSNHWTIDQIKKIYPSLELPLNIKGKLNSKINLKKKKDVISGNLNLDSKSLNLNYPGQLVLKKVPLDFKSSFIYQDQELSLKKTSFLIAKEKLNLNSLKYKEEKYNFVMSFNSKNISFWKKALKSFSDLPPLSGGLSVKLKGKGNKSHHQLNYELKSKRITAKIDKKNKLQLPLNIVGSLKSNPKITKINKTTISLGDPQIELTGFKKKDESQEVKLKFRAKNSKFISLIYPEMKDLPLIQGIQGNAKYSKKNSKSEPTLNGLMKAKKILHPEYPLGNFNAKLNYHNSKLMLKELTANTLGGSISGKAKVLLNDPKPKYFLDLNLNKISLSRISSLSGLVTGKGNLKLKAKGQGFSENDWKRNLSATGNVSGSKLKFSKLKVMKKTLEDPIWKLLLRRPGLIDNKAWNQIKNWSTQVDALSTKFFIKKGSLILPKNKLKLSGWGLNLGGKINLDQSLNMKGSVIVDKKTLQILIKDKKISSVLLAGQNSLKIPLTVTGDTNNPKMKLKTSVIGQRITQSIAKSAQQEIQKKIKDQAKKKLDKVLNKEEQKDLEDLKKLEDEIRSWF